MASLEQVKDLLKNTLELDDSFDSSDEETLLLGNIAELDSMAVISVITALEENFGIVVDDDDISGETFESIGSLIKFLKSKEN